MKKIFYALFALLMIVLSGVFTPDNISTYAYYTSEDYYITDYDVTVDVALNNTYSITETIVVDFNSYDGTNEKHGIIRAIPLVQTVTRNVKGTYVDYRYSVSVKNLTVNNSYSTDSTDFTDMEMSYLYIQIGDEDELVNGETITYVISYDYVLGYDRIEDYDDFYFNIIGDNWDTTIDNVTFTINMPTAFIADSLSVYAGLFGSIDTITATVNNNTITQNLPISLDAYEALTIRLTLPNDYFSEVTKINDFVDIIAICLMVLLFSLMLFISLKYYKKVRVVPTVEFYPPENMNPAELAYILNGYVKNKDISALIIYWANKGCINIVIDENKKITLKKTGEIFEGAKAYEKSIFAALFKEKEEVALDSLTDKNNEDKLSNIVSSYMKTSKTSSSSNSVGTIMYNSKFQVAGEAGGFKYDSRSIKSIVYLCLLSIAIMFIPLGLQVYKIGIISDFINLIYVALVFLAAVFLALKAKDSDLKQSTKGLCTFGILSGVTYIAMTLLCLVLADKTINFWYIYIISCVLCYIGLFLIMRSLYLKNEFAEKMGKIIGFKNFILKSEKDRMRVLLKDNPEYYFDVLPFAYVLDITDEFAEKFSGLVVQAPKYIAYHSTNLFDVIIFNSIINSSFNRFSHNAIVPPVSHGSMGGRSGGGFGGGFSGGGFGGGGGSSW